jgi:hypothetical protein
MLLVDPNDLTENSIIISTLMGSKWKTWMPAFSFMVGARI